MCNTIVLGAKVYQEMLTYSMSSLMLITGAVLKLEPYNLVNVHLVQSLGRWPGAGLLS